MSEGGPAHAKRFTFAVRVNTTDKGWTDECVGEAMPSVKKAKDSAAVLLLELINKLYSSSKIYGWMVGCQIINLPCPNQNQWLFNKLLDFTNWEKNCI